jgi:hypothetical protein
MAVLVKTIWLERGNASLPSITLLSKVAVGFWFDWLNQFLGSLWPVKWLSPEEFRRGEAGLASCDGTELELIRREASRARRWCWSVTE